jgi:nucleoside-diphosphate-sugar epimerase
MPFPPLPKEDLEHVLEQTRPLWEQLRGGRVFVTGSTGFFGSWLLETFAHANSSLNLGASLVGLSRDPAAFYVKVPHLVGESSITLQRGDVRDFGFPEGTFTHVIHAGTAPGALISGDEMLDTIVRGTERTLEFAVSAGANRFLFVSSGAVYGKQPSEMTHIAETYQLKLDPADSNYAYAHGKRLGEELCVAAHQKHGLEATIARCFAFVGPHLPLDAHFAMGNFIRDAMRGEPIRVKDGSPYRSYLYAADLAIWLWTILFKGKPCHPYNVGSDQQITISQLAETIASVLGGSVHSIPTLTLPPATSPSRYVPEIRRIMSELELAEPIKLYESIARTANYHRPISSS